MATEHTSGQTSIPRRTFVKGAAIATAFTIVPSYVAAKSKKSKKNDTVPPSERVNLACIGIDGRGSADTKSMANTGLANIVALCDVDSARGGKIRKQFSGAKFFQDFRKMFDEMGDKIDACTVAVPDHAHFPISMLAMSLGKHCYIEKPLAHTFHECELLMAAEKKYKVACQMGNQGFSGNNYFQFKSWSEAGIIKDVTKIDAFMNSSRRWHGWKVDGYPEGGKPPASIDWDLWCGTAPMHGFSEKLHPGNWRSWYDYGDGAFGDWGPHILDTCHHFLKLGLPTEIEAVKRDGPSDYIFPQASTIRFHFPARNGMPPCDVFWYDGKGNEPKLPKEMEGRKLRGPGKIIYGKELTFLGGHHGATCRIIPENKMRDMGPKLPKISGKNSSHSSNFLLAAKGQEKTRSNLAVAGELTQVFVLGVIAQHVGGLLKFDPKTKQITNNPEANKWVKGHRPRPGWEKYYTL